jgi:hypothetical protein
MSAPYNQSFIYPMNLFSHQQPVYQYTVLKCVSKRPEIMELEVFKLFKGVFG